MSDPFKNSRAYYDVTVPSSGDGFQLISQLKNALQGLGFMDMIPLQPRAHSPADNKIMIRGRDASGFYNPIYAGDVNSRIFFSSGDSPAFSAPASNPRIDIVYITPSGDIKIQQGVEAASPALPSLAPSGDTRFPVCAVYNRPSQTKIFNFENSAANTGDGYIYQDLRPFLSQPKQSTAITFSAVTPISPTGDAQAGPGTSANPARSDHVHGGVHAVRVAGQSNIQGDVEIAGAGGVLTQAGNRITINGGMVQEVNIQTGAVATGSTVLPGDDTIPQSNEGDQYMTLSITPKNANNKLKIQVVFNGSNDTSSSLGVALFQDAIANALAAMFVDPSGPANDTSCIVFTHYMVAGTVSSITFKVRAGSSGGTTTFNGTGGTRKYGGVQASSITITEVAV